MGKLVTEDLEKLLSYVKKDPRVIVHPQSGFDSGVHLMDGDKYLVVSTDPCIGVPEEWFGWFLVHYVASDIALFGAKMEFCTINLLGSPATKPPVFCSVMRQACSAANELGVAVVAGHTGTYEGLSTLLGVCTGYGAVDRSSLITPAGAKAGDLVLCVKPIGLEIAVNLAFTHWALAEKLFGVQRKRELVNLVPQQSCVREAMFLAEEKGVHAMHDATEGGLTVALNEVAEASGVGFRIEWEKIPIPEEVYRLREFYGLSYEQLLCMSSTGTIVAAVSPEAKGKVEEVLRRNNVEASFVGSFTKDKCRVLVKDGEEVSFPKRFDDPYARILLGKV